MNKKTILITGASGDLGGAAAHYFLERGWHVIAPVRSLGKPEVQELMKLPDIDVILCDIEKANLVDQFIKSLKNDGVHIDHVFLAAGQFLWDDGYPDKELFARKVSPEEVRDILMRANVTTKETVIKALQYQYAGELHETALTMVASHAGKWPPEHPLRNGPFGQEGYVAPMAKVIGLGEELRSEPNPDKRFKSVTVLETPLIDGVMSRKAFTPERAPDVDWSKAKKSKDYMEETFAPTAL